MGRSKRSLHLGKFSSEGEENRQPNPQRQRVATRDHHPNIVETRIQLGVTPNTKLEFFAALGINETVYQFAADYYNAIVNPEHHPWLKAQGLTFFTQLDWTTNNTPMEDIVGLAKSFDPDTKTCTWKGNEIRLSYQ